MLTRIALIIGLFAVTADAGESYVVSGHAPHAGGEYVGSGCTSCGTGHGHHGGGCSSCGSSFLWGTKCGPNRYLFDCHGLWCAPGNLVQHLMYYPAAHGNYYFHPYNYTKIKEQQQIAGAWGEDPYMPYANTIFKKVYAELEQEGVLEPLGGSTAVSMDDMEVPVAPMIVPEDMDLKAPPIEDGSYNSEGAVPSFIRVEFQER